MIGISLREVSSVGFRACCCAVTTTRERQLWTEFDGRAMILFGLAEEIHVNAMSTTVCHFVLVCDAE